MDTCLNKNIDNSVAKHVAHTAHLWKGHPEFFDMSTPEGGDSCFARLYHPDTGVSPSPRRIIEDVMRFLVACQDICFADGSIVEKISGRTIRYGHCADVEKEARIRPKVRGGKRVAKEITDNDFEMHADLIDLQAERSRLLLIPNSAMTHTMRTQEIDDAAMDLAPAVLEGTDDALQVDNSIGINL